MTILYPKFAAMVAKHSYALLRLTKVNVNMSTFPLVLVGIGVKDSSHLMVTAPPLTFSAVGRYPVAPCVWNKVTVKVLPSVVGALVMFTVKLAEKLVLVR